MKKWITEKLNTRICSSRSTPSRDKYSILCSWVFLLIFWNRICKWKSLHMMQRARIWCSTKPWLMLKRKSSPICRFYRLWVSICLRPRHLRCFEVWDSWSVSWFRAWPSSKHPWYRIKARDLPHWIKTSWYLRNISPRGALTTIIRRRWFSTPNSWFKKQTFRRKDRSFWQMLEASLCQNIWYRAHKVAESWKLLRHISHTTRASLTTKSSRITRCFWNLRSQSWFSPASILNAHLRSWVKWLNQETSLETMNIDSRFSIKHWIVCSRIQSIPIWKPVWSCWWKTICMYRPSYFVLTRLRIQCKRRNSWFRSLRPWSKVK